MIIKYCFTNHELVSGWGGNDDTYNRRCNHFYHTSILNTRSTNQFTHIVAQPCWWMISVHDLWGTRLGLVAVLMRHVLQLPARALIKVSIVHMHTLLFQLGPLWNKYSAFGLGLTVLYVNFIISLETDMLCCWYEENGLVNGLVKIQWTVRLVHLFICWRVDWFMRITFHTKHPIVRE